MLRLLRLFFSAMIFIMMMIALVSCGRNDSADVKADVNANITFDSANVNKIISLAPSITETLVELQLDDKIVGVTRFCKFPNESDNNREIAILDERSYELILRTAPDLAIILVEQTELAAFLEKYNIRYITVSSESIADIFTSIKKIANAGGVGERGDSIVQSLQDRVDSLQVALSQSTRAPRKVLLCVGRSDIGSGRISAVYAAGARSFYNELITLAGGVNVLADVAQAYPQISTEAILRRAPDVIIDLSFANVENISENACEFWQSLRNVSAVKNNKAYCLTGNYLTIPGIRIIDIAETFSQYIGQI